MKNFIRKERVDKVFLNRSTQWIGLSSMLVQFGRISLGIATLFAPARLRLVIAERPLGSIYSEYTNFFFHAFEFFLLAVIGFWSASLFLQPRRVAIGPIVLAIPITGLWLAGAIGLPFSADPMLSAYHLASLALMIGIYLFIVNEIDRMDQIGWAIALSLVIHAGIAIVQGLKQGSLGLFWLGEHELDLAADGVSLIWVEGMRSLRAYGLTDHPNILGGLLGIGLLLFTVIFLEIGDLRERLFIPSSIFILGLFGLMFTFSRSAWLAVMLAGMWIFWRLFRQREFGSLQVLGSVLLSAAILLAPFIYHYFPLIAETMFPGQDPTTSLAEHQSQIEQVALNQAANRIFENNAIAGAGIGSFPIALWQTNPDFGYYFQPPHIVLLEIAAELGIFGAMFYFFLLLAPWLVLWINRKRLSFSLALEVASAALLAITLISFLDYYPWLLAPGRFFYWLILGLFAHSYSVALNR